MPDPSMLRDSTQIVLPRDTLEEVDAQLDDRFVLTITDEDDYCRIIGSPVEIKEASEFLTRRGVSLP